MVFVLLEQAYAAALTLVAPPYLYFTVNVIILVIALSSFFNSAAESPPEEPPAAELIKFLVPPPVQQTAFKEDVAVEKPLASARFSPRKSPKQTSEGKILGVAKLKRNESLESTWKAITGGAKETMDDGDEGSWSRAREASLGKDDVNKRVEEFIRRIKGDVRIRRQESFKRFSQSMNRRARVLEREKKRPLERESSPT